jgi:uncharacterized protein
MTNMSTLQYNVSQLLKSDVGTTRSYDFESDARMDLDDGSARNIRGSLKFTLTNFGILATVEATAVLELNCARCLEGFELPTNIHFGEEYQPLIDVATGLPSTTPRIDTAFSISENHTVDLWEAIRQQLLLTIELVPVCRPDCKGLCPECGVNLNEEACKCPPQEAPSPFAVLQGLLSEEADK